MTAPKMYGLEAIAAFVVELAQWTGRGYVSIGGSAPYGAQLRIHATCAPRTGVQAHLDSGMLSISRWAS